MRPVIFYIINFFACVCLGLGICVLPSLCGAAEDDDQNDASFQEEEVVVTAGQTSESLDDPPVFIEKIEMDQFQGRFVSAAEAVSQAAGVTIRDFGGLGKLTTVHIRGSSSDQVVVLVDGVRLNPGSGGGVDLSTIPADQIERIEIIRGGDSAFYGDGAVGGVINIVTKKPKNKSSTHLGTTYGSFNTLQATAARDQGFKKGGILASAGYLHTDGNFRYKSDGGTALDSSDDRVKLRKNNASDERTFLLKGRYEVSDHFAISGQSDIFSSIRGVPGLITFPSENAWQKDLRNLTQFNLVFSELPAPGLTFKTAFSHRYNNQQFSDRLGEQTGVPVDTEYSEFEPRIAQNIQYIWGSHQILSLQGEGYRTLLREQDNVFDNPERNAWSGALRDQIMFWDARITLVPAIRYDNIDGAGDQWSPKFGLNFRPLDWLVIKGNAGQSFRAPNFSELFFSQGFVEGNEDLKPERATSYDAGLQIVTTPFFFEGAWFRTDVEDLIEYLLVSGFRYKPFNIGQATLQGAEFLTRIKPWEYISAAGSFTITYAIDETGLPNRDGNQIPGRPRYKGFGRLQAGPKLMSGFAEYNYIGKNFITQANTKTLPERNIVNGGIVAQPSENYRFGVEMKNILDEMEQDVRGFPLPGRSIFLTFEANF